jgi:outer membrane protein TolC
VITGAEWSLTHALSRTSDDLLTSSLSTKYEPILTFQIKQPLLRDAWPDLNLSGITVSQLNYVSAFAAFRQRAEEVSTEVISLYWTLLQALKDVEIQQSLLEKTNETLQKVQNRRLIDATDVQVKQTEAALRSREATLLDTKKQFRDVQDALVRLLSDHQFNLLSDLEIIPITAPNIRAMEFDQTQLINRAQNNNPLIKQAQLAVKISDINIRVANRQKMPRLDVVASSSVQGLSDSRGDANDTLWDGDFNSYAIGLTLEYPLGNRDRSAVLRQRKLERSKSVSNLQNVSDQVATQIKERIRLAQKTYEEMEIQKSAVNASKIYLEALENVEEIREELTPEFLLVKLQAQESLANSQRAEIKAVVDYNIALVRLAQATGNVLDLHYVKTALQKISPQNIPSQLIMNPEISEETSTVKIDEDIVEQQGDTPPDDQDQSEEKEPESPDERVNIEVIEAVENAGTEQLIAHPQKAGLETYYIQVGSWKNPDYAQNMLKRLKKQYPDVYIYKHNTFHKIRIPNVTSQPHGSKIITEITEKYNLNPLLVTGQN